MSSSIIVEKIDGTFEPFSEKKYRLALERSGLVPSEVQSVLSHIVSTLQNNITTKELYAQTFAYLKTLRASLACRYSLKRAIMELGPSGYPFEKFIGALFEVQGYTVSVGMVVAGKCVSHEVDVVAQRDDNKFFIECKFHNKQHLRSRIKDPLYIKARFDDLCLGYAQKKEGSISCHHGMLVTNTKFSEDVLAYGPCAGIKLLSWNYPKGESLASLIDLHNMHPVTCLTSISLAHKQAMFRQDIVLCRDILKNEKKVLSIVRDKKRAMKIFDQVQELKKK